MSEETFEQSATTQAERCPTQDKAFRLVVNQLDKMKERLIAKRITPLFCFELFILNCDQHDGPAHHVDLATSGLSNIGADGMPHVIAAIESLLKELKSRTT